MMRRGNEEEKEEGEEGKDGKEGIAAVEDLRFPRSPKRLFIFTMTTRQRRWYNRRIIRSVQG